MFKKETLKFRFPLRILLAVTALVVTVGVLHLVFPVSSAPVTPGATSKLTVYQGVVTIAPGGSGNDILELGNAGRDIAGRGDIYIRPGSISGDPTTFAKFYAVAGPPSKVWLDVAGKVTVGQLQVNPQNTSDDGGQIDLIKSQAAYHDWSIELFQDRIRFFTNGGSKFDFDNAGAAYVTKLCFGAYPNNNCMNAPGGGAGTLDSVLQAGNSSARTILMNSQPTDQKVISVTNQAGAPAFGAGSYAFLTAYSQNNGAYSLITRANDSGLFFSRDTGLTISGWNTAGTAKGVRVTGSGVLNAAFSVNNGASGGVIPGFGSSGDAIAAYANSINSALFGQQAGTGYAAYLTRGVAGSNSNASLYVDNNYNFFGSGVVNTKAAQIIGDVEVKQYGLGAQVWGAVDVMEIVGSSDTTTAGYVFHARNLNADGWAGYFEGATYIKGKAGDNLGVSSNIPAALYVENSRTVDDSTNPPGTGNTGGGSTAVYGKAGKALGALWDFAVPSSIGVVGEGAATLAGTTSAGIYGKSGAGAGTNYAGYFAGNVSITGNVGVGQDNPGAKFVVNNNLSRTGSSDNAIAAYADTLGNDIYAWQNNFSGNAIFADQPYDPGFAGYFNGSVKITGGLTLGARKKSTWPLQVCQVGGNGCLGPYLYSTGTLTSNLTYYYWAGANTITPVTVFSVVAAGSCAPLTTAVTGGSGGTSRYDDDNCNPGSGEYVNLAAGIPYRAANTPLCRANTGIPNVVQQRLNANGQSCVKNVATITGYQITGVSTGTTTQLYELR